MCSSPTSNWHLSWTLCTAKVQEAHRDLKTALPVCTNLRPVPVGLDYNGSHIHVFQLYMKLQSTSKYLQNIYFQSLLIPTVMQSCSAKQCLSSKWKCLAFNTTQWKIHAILGVNLKESQAAIRRSGNTNYERICFIIAKGGKKQRKPLIWERVYICKCVFRYQICLVHWYF